MSTAAATIRPDRFLRARAARRLYYEKPRSPMHRGFLVLFDGPLSPTEVTSHIESRLDRLPHARLKAVPAPLNVGHPSWQADSEFDLARHITTHELAKGKGPEALFALASELFSTVLSRDQPLWQVHLLRSPDAPGSALLIRVHQAILGSAPQIGGRGIDAASWLQGLFETTGNAPTSSEQPRATATPLPDADRSLGDALLARSIEAMEAWTHLGIGALDVAHEWRTERTFTAYESLFETMPDFALPIRRLPFNKPTGGQSRLELCELSLAEARAVRRKLSGTINDLILTLVAGAVARYAEAHGQNVRRRGLRVMMPVPLRPGPNSKRGASSILPLTLPLSIADPVQRLRKIREMTRLLRSAGVPEAMERSRSLSGVIPPALQALAGSLYRGYGFPEFHLPLEASAGPQIPLFFAGQRAVAMVPYVPPTYNQGLTVAAHSYDQQLYLGLAGDREACPDLELLRDLIDAEMGEIRKALDIDSIGSIETEKQTRSAN